MALPGHGKGGIYAEQSISKCNLTEQSVASPAGISAVFSTAHSIYLQEHTFCRRPLISNDLTSNILTLAPLIMTSHHTFAPVLTITGPRKKWEGSERVGPRRKGRVAKEWGQEERGMRSQRKVRLSRSLPMGLLEKTMSLFRDLDAAQPRSLNFVMRVGS